MIVFKLGATFFVFFLLATIFCFIAGDTLSGSVAADRKEREAMWRKRLGWSATLMLVCFWLAIVGLIWH